MTHAPLYRLELLTAMLLSCTLFVVSPAHAEPDVSFTAFAAGVEATHVGTSGPIQLQLDDGSAEGSVGAGGPTADQFLWFNRFSVADQFVLNAISVLFPSDPNIAIGDAVDLVIYSDANQDPTDGADLVQVIPVAVQHVDGATFSVYPIAPERVQGEIYIGVIPRFITSGSDPPTSPAALDTSSSQQRSWLAQWNGDPPANPMLPSADQLLLIDVVASGNWMIRASGRPLLVTEVPSLGRWSLWLLAMSLAGVGVLRLR